MTDPNGPTRREFDSLDRRVGRLELLDYGRLVERLDQHIQVGSEHRQDSRARIDRLAEELDSLRKVMVGLMVSIAGSAIIVALTVSLAL